MKTKQIALGLIAMLLVGAGVLSGCIDTTTPATITPNVDWDVNCMGDDNATVVNNAARTITIFCDVNSTTNEMYYRGCDWLLFQETELHFELTPQQGDSDVIDIMQGFVTECSIVNPDVSVHSTNGNDLGLVSKNNQNMYSYNWSYVGNLRYEKIKVTTTTWFPTEVELDIDWNEVAVSYIGAGRSKAINMDLAGQSWVILLNVNTVWT